MTGAIMRSEDSRTSEDIGSMSDTALGPQSPLLSAEEITQPAGGNWVSAWSLVAGGSRKARAAAKSEKLKKRLQECRSEQQGDQQ